MPKMIKNLFTSLRHHLVLAACSIVVVTLVACSGGSDSTSVTQPIYTAIFDAGSSGTRLSLYKVIPANGGYPTIEKIATFDRDESGVLDDDGINDFLNGAGTVEPSIDDPLPADCPVANSGSLGRTDVEPCVIQPLLTKLEQAIVTLNTNNPNLNLTKSQVQVELFATAGMRTEDIRNGGSHTTADIESYYNEMKTYVAQQGFGVGQFKTINGNSEEGVWTWTNLNDYYFNAFGGNPTVSKTVQAPVGDFEVGGSSMQIAFPIDASPSDDNNIYRVSINGRTFNVYSKTFLGLGADDARKYVKAFNYASNTGGASCYPASVNSLDTADFNKWINESSGIMLYPNTQTSSRTPSYPFPSNLNTTTPWTFIQPASLALTQGNASFNNSICSTQYNTIVNQVTSLDRNNYGTDSLGSQATMSNFKTALQRSIAPFYGTDNFFFSTNDLGYAPTSAFDPTIFNSLLLNHCTSGTAPNIGRRNANTCPNGMYMYTYLFGTSGLFNGSSDSFAGVLNPRDSSGETVLTWTRGYLLIKYAN
jgi:GDA1/CD39 (nucleoside phosphatase) family